MNCIHTFCSTVVRVTAIVIMEITQPGVLIKHTPPHPYYTSLYSARHISGNFNPIRSGLFQTANDPGGALKAPPPLYDLENSFVNLHHIIHVHFTRCFKHVPIGIFQKFAILTILQRF